MIKKLNILIFPFAFLLVFAPINSIKAQVKTKVSWTTSIDKKSWENKDKLTVTFKGKVDKDWYVYASDFDPECGPTVATLELENEDYYSVNGTLVSLNTHKKYDDTFGCDVTTMYPEAVFRQSFNVKNGIGNLSGTLYYQACSSIDGLCIQYAEDFNFKNENPQKTPPSKKGNGLTLPKDQMSHSLVNQDVKKGTNIPLKNEKDDQNAIINNGSGDLENRKGSIKNQQEKGESTTPITTPLDGNFTVSEKNTLDPDASSIDQTTEATEMVSEKGAIKMDSFFTEEIQPNQDTQNSGLIGFLIAAFLSGLIALFTPCVFPMIPMTVSFFTSGGNKSKAFIYGLSIIVIYTLVGASIAPLMGPDTANHLATSWFLNLLFFIVFIVFALSFFGMFEIVLPSKLVNNMDEKSEKGGLVGVFFMAFTLVLVSFSCTGPIVGSLLVQSAGGKFLKPILGMAAFGTAFALPFTLFALFPGLLNRLPKSGGWLNSVKVVLGFIELALALKFLSIADQAYHWGILDREVNIALWIVIFGALGFYLLGKIRLPHDSPMDNIPVPRMILAILTFSFVIYLIPGMIGHPLKALAGYLPPMHTHDFNLFESLNQKDSETAAAGNEICEPPLYNDFLHLPHGLKGYFDYDQALQCARKQNKPLFIDFTGHGCTNCREMEAVVWKEPEVLKRMKENFVVVALYVDDKTELPSEKWYTSAFDQKVKKTIGRQNADLQIQRAENNAQPNYILLGTDEKILTEPKARDLNAKNFVKFLEEGYQNFNRKFN